MTNITNISSGLTAEGQEELLIALKNLKPEQLFTFHEGLDEIDDLNCIADEIFSFGYDTIIDYVFSQIKFVDFDPKERVEKNGLRNFLYKISQHENINKIIETHGCEGECAELLMQYYFIFNCFKSNFNKDILPHVNIDKLFAFVINNSNCVPQFEKFLHTYPINTAVADKYYSDAKHFMNYKSYYQEKKKIYYTFLEKQMLNGVIENKDKMKVIKL